MTDDIFIKSNKQLKTEERIAIREQFLGEKRVAAITQRWEKAQIDAATWQSVLDHAVGLYNEHKEELDEEMTTQTKAQIDERQKQISEFLMTEKDLYLESMGIQSD
jgi:hypothetical protein